MRILEEITSAMVYRLIGKYDQILTIFFKSKSKLVSELNPNIIATIDYSQKERILFASNDDDFINTYSKEIIKINILMPELDIEKKLKYKLDGIKCSEIDQILYLPPSSFEQESQEILIKTVPNIISIPYESKGIYDYENMFLGLYNRLVRENKPLLYDEMMEYLGIHAAFHYKKTSSTLLEKFGVTLSELTTNSIFWISYFRTKEIAVPLSLKEKQDYTDHKVAVWYKKLFLLSNELMKAGKLENDESINEKIEIIGKEVEKFKTSRFNNDPLIYWDLESYLHIVLRHFKETKIGFNNKDKTEIPYRVGDLKTLIDKIIYDNMEEIEHNFRTNKGQKFYRTGARSFYFNHDYYSIDIEADGRISAFYKN